MEQLAEAWEKVAMLAAVQPEAAGAAPHSSTWARQRLLSVEAPMPSLSQVTVTCKVWWRNQVSVFVSNWVHASCQPTRQNLPHVLPLPPLRAMRSVRHMTRTAPTPNLLSYVGW